ncbi:unnamed protein product [Ectocarpus sp. 12 AP-2014]
MNGASKKRRRLSPGSGGPDTDFERLARRSLIEAALSVGALVTRDRVAAVGFAENARQLLKEIFDVPSEEASSAFLCLAYFNTYSGEALRADLYLVQAHSFCLNLPEFPLNLEICIEHLSHGRLKIELRPNFHTWGNRRYRVLHVANHVLSMLTQTGDRGLPAALQAGDPLAFEGGEAALLRCVEELVTCIRISERDTLARLICSSLVGLLLMLLGRREESIAVAESVAEGVTPTPAITRVMPLSWTATTVTSALLFIYERHGVYSRLYELVAPAQRLSGSAGQEGECALPLPGSDVGEYLRHTCRPSTFCQLVVTISRLTDRGTKNFCPTPDASQGASQDDRWPAMSGLFNNTGGGLVGSAAAGAGARRVDGGGGGGGGDAMRGGGVPRGADVDKAEEECAGTQLAELLASLPPASPPKLSGLVDVESYTDLPSHMNDLAEGVARRGSGGLGGGGSGRAGEPGYFRGASPLPFLGRTSSQGRELQVQHQHQQPRRLTTLARGGAQSSSRSGVHRGPPYFPDLGDQHQQQQQQQQQQHSNSNSNSNSSRSTGVIAARRTFRTLETSSSSNNNNSNNSNSSNSSSSSNSSTLLGCTADHQCFLLTSPKEELS